MSSPILALDQGTTSSRAIVFDRKCRIVSVDQQEFPQIFPRPGWVEHDPEAIWDSQLATAKKAIAKCGQPADHIAALGITNQRETAVLWERDTGRPVANAIVWQSRHSADICDRLRADGLEEIFRAKTGLVVDAYFSGTKITWLLENVDGLRSRAEKGEILFGTMDSFLIWRLTGGQAHVTDFSNASRTLIYNIHTLDWDDELLDLLKIPRAMLPEVRPSSGVVECTDPSLFGASIPIAGIAGDQQAATFGQGCFEIGSAKNTYGTGCFMLMNTGSRPVASDNGLLTTIGWHINGETTYCLEGSIFVAGAVVQWLRDGLGLIENASEIESLAAGVEDSGGVILVPAFVGLGAPWWDSRARGTIFGITRGTTQAHLARAALDSIAFQTRDILDAMQQDCAAAPGFLNVDGGATANNLLMQIQADLVQVPVHRPVVQETTALGAACLAGLAVGVWQDLKNVPAGSELDRKFSPAQPSELSNSRLAKWRHAVECTRQFTGDFSVL